MRRRNGLPAGEPPKGSLSNAPDGKSNGDFRHGGPRERSVAAPRCMRDLLRDVRRLVDSGSNPVADRLQRWSTSGCNMKSDELKIAVTNEEDKTLRENLIQ